MNEKSEGFSQGRYVENLPATMRSTGEPPGPELTAGAPIDPSTSATESTADFAGCAGPGTSAGGESGTGASGAEASGAPIEDQLGAASASVTKAVDDVIVAVRTLVGTDEGHRYIEAQVNRAGETLSGVLKDLQARVDSTIKKK
jgi:hypothetical protein